MAGVLGEALALDGTGRLIDVGCGPGSVALLLAPLFAEVVGIDPDPGMIEQAETSAAVLGVRNARWVQMTAESLPGNLGQFRVATFAQSFHWMDRELVASIVREMLEPGGAWVHLHATTHEGVGSGRDRPWPSPPRAAIAALIRAYLGPTRRAGQTRCQTGRPREKRRSCSSLGSPNQLARSFQETSTSAPKTRSSLQCSRSRAPHLTSSRNGKPRSRRSFANSFGNLPAARFAEEARDVELVIWRPT